MPVNFVAVQVMEKAEAKYRTVWTTVTQHLKLCVVWEQPIDGQCRLESSWQRVPILIDRYQNYEGQQFAERAY